MKFDVYCDGGLVGPNPSRRGGTWAYCWVRRTVRIRTRSGVVTPDDLDVEAVTNNHTELLAAVLALESVPPDWSGTLFTDSRITACRLARRDVPFRGTPPWLVQRARALAGRFKIVLVGGHPTELELMIGYRKGSRLPVSEHNVACDKMCTLAAKSARG